MFRAVGTLAAHLNYTVDAAYFMKRSENYRNLWNAQEKYLCPRSASGKYQCPLDPVSREWIVKDTGYTEGSMEEMIRKLYNYIMFFR